MRRILLVAVVGLSALSGCDLYMGPPDDSYTYGYCDEEGCYECGEWGCTNTGNGGWGGWGGSADANPGNFGPGASCYDNSQCAPGCYCDTRGSGLCVESGWCDGINPCWQEGFVCDNRQTCVPQNSDPPPGCTAHDQCNGGYCDFATSQCRPSNWCVKDTDCATGYACDERKVCVPSTCRADEECGPGCYCDEARGSCIETGFCSDDSGCTLLGMVCDEARTSCEPAETTPPPNCDEPKECPPGQSCDPCSGERPVDPTLRCTYDGECGGGDCQNGLCHSPCTTDANCGTGDICVSGFCHANPNPAATCVFNADCGAGFTCINGTCHANCATNTACANLADFCDDGICQPDWRRVSECTINAHCQNGEQCVDGQCRTRCMQDADCDICQDGPSCVTGYCQEVETNH